MPSQLALDQCYMQVAEAHAALSKAQRAKVGACLVTQQGSILPGYNGLPKAFGNTLEYKDEFGNLLTKPEVVHAELNCIMKAAKTGVQVQGSTLYVTLSPCLHCSALMLEAGVKEVIYRDEYRNPAGINALKEAGVTVRRFNAYHSKAEERQKVVL